MQDGLTKYESKGDLNIEYENETKISHNARWTKQWVESKREN